MRFAVVRRVGSGAGGGRFEALLEWRSMLGIRGEKTRTEFSHSLFSAVLMRGTVKS